VTIKISFDCEFVAITLKGSCCRD